SHEMAETITDPFGTSWQGDFITQGVEIAELCAYSEIGADTYTQIHSNAGSPFTTPRFLSRGMFLQNLPSCPDYPTVACCRDGGECKWGRDRDLVCAGNRVGVKILTDGWPGTAAATVRQGCATDGSLLPAQQMVVSYDSQGGSTCVTVQTTL